MLYYEYEYNYYCSLSYCTSTIPYIRCWYEYEYEYCMYCIRTGKVRYESSYEHPGHGDDDRTVLVLVALVGDIPGPHRSR